MILTWNRSVSNLISGNDEIRIVERHLLESLAPARLLRESGAKRFVDFGSGAGLPGIPLAILGVGEHWTLVESRRPKVLFMRKAIQDLSLAGVEIVHGRLEVWSEEENPGTFDGFTSRATMALGPTLHFAERLIAPGGSAFLWKGSRHDEEMASDAGWAAAWSHRGTSALGTSQAVMSRFERT